MVQLFTVTAPVSYAYNSTLGYETVELNEEDFNSRLTNEVYYSTNGRISRLNDITQYNIDVFTQDVEEILNRFATLVAYQHIPPLHSLNKLSSTSLVNVDFSTIGLQYGDIIKFHVNVNVSSSDGNTDPLPISATFIVKIADENIEL